MNTTQTSLLFFHPLSHTAGALTWRPGADSYLTILQQATGESYNNSVALAVAVPTSFTNFFTEHQWFIILNESCPKGRTLH